MSDTAKQFQMTAKRSSPVSELERHLGILANLSYLIRENSDDPAHVEEYVYMLDFAVKDLSKAIRTMPELHVMESDSIAS
jgi:hypothetical protein